MTYDFEPKDEAPVRFQADHLPVSKRPVLAVETREDEELGPIGPGESIVIYLSEHVEMEEARALAGRLNDLVDRLVVAEGNPSS